MGRCVTGSRRISAWNMFWAYSRYGKYRLQCKKCMWKRKADSSLGASITTWMMRYASTLVQKEKNTIQEGKWKYSNKWFHVWCKVRYVQQKIVRITVYITEEQRFVSRRKVQNRQVQPSIITVIRENFWWHWSNAGEFRQLPRSLFCLHRLSLEWTGWSYAKDKLGVPILVVPFWVPRLLMGSGTSPCRRRQSHEWLGLVLLGGDRS